MTTTKKLGIWMDHADAHLMEFVTDTIELNSIESTFSHQEKTESMGRSENIMHNKEQHQQAGYYKNLAEKIMNYDEVVLFGPTNAKAELLNILKENHHFDKIKIEVKQTDNMTQNQQQAFVRTHFANH